MTSPSLTFREAFRAWAKIGLLGFGGPAGQIALMHRLLVDEKRWIDEARFLHALNFCMLLPGPEAQQLATYIGWLLHGARGALAAGLLFILPGVAVIFTLSALYVGYGDTPHVQAAFFGIKAAVVALVIEAVAKLARRAAKTRFHVGLAVAAFAALAVFHAPFPLVVLAAAGLGWIVNRFHHSGEGRNPDQAAAPDTGLRRHDGQNPHRYAALSHILRISAIFLPLWGAPVLAAFVWGPPVLAHLGLFFSKMAVVTFGGAYAVLAYVAQQAVDHFRWLRPGEMLDGLGLAETTPGPLLLVLQFVGFVAAFRQPGALEPMLAAALGAGITLWVTFLPCFYWIFLAAPFVEKLRGNTALSAALAGVSAAVVGVIANLALWFALHVLFARTVVMAGITLPDPASLDGAALALALLAGLALVRFKINVALAIPLAALAGMALSVLR